MNENIRITLQDAAGLRSGGIRIRNHKARYCESVDQISIFGNLYSDNSYLTFFMEPRVVAEFKNARGDTCFACMGDNYGSFWVNREAVFCITACNLSEKCNFREVTEISLRIVFQQP